LPLELFVFVGCFLEEVISPIPSFVVLIPAGAAAQVQGIGWWYLLVLAVFGATGRILASMILYGVADKGEDWLFGKGRRLFGISHKQLKRFGRRFNGSKHDWLVLFLLNAIPVVPTSLLSLACGFIKIDFRTFITATFLGSAVNAVIYMSIGYAGLAVVSDLRDLELVFQIIAIVVLLAAIAWFVRRRQKRGR
jgi:membrane protein DedA with SNARE-associated domain